MNPSIFRVVILLAFLSIKLSAQSITTAPPIEYGEVVGGLNGGTYIALRGVSSFFIVKYFVGGNTSSTQLSKVGDNGWTKTLCSVFSSGCGFYQANLYASQDDGILILYGSELKQFDTNGNLRWSRNINFQLKGATANLIGGFYLHTVENSNGTTKVSRLRGDGGQEWVIDFGNILIKDIQTTSDDGVILTGDTWSRKYSSEGKLQWNIDTGGSNILIIDPSNFYIVGSLSVSKYSIANGFRQWSKSFEQITDAKITRDNGIAFLSNTALTKLNGNGDTEWRNFDWGGGKQLVISEDGFIVVLKNNFISKLNYENKLIWVKEMNNNINAGSTLKVFGASDNSLFITGQTYLTGTSGWAGILLKTAPYDTTCRYKPLLSPNQNLDFCRTANSTFYGGLSNLNSNLLSNISKDFTVQWQKDGRDIVSANSPSLSVNSKGNYSLKITQGKCSISSDTVKLKILNEKPPSITELDEYLCNGKSTKLTATGCDGAVNWSTGAVGSSITVSPVSNTSYNAYCTANYSESGVLKVCTSDQSNVVDIKVSPVTEIKLSKITGQNVICGSNNTNLSITLSGGTEPYTYRWLRNDTDYLKSSNNYLTTGLSGDYSVIVNDKYGCSANSDNFKVAKSDMKISVEGNRDFCAGSSTVLNALVSNGIGKYSYVWKKNDVEVGTQNSLSINSGGNYIVLVVDSTNCKIQSSPIIVTEKGGGIVASISVIGNTSIYEPDSVTLNAAMGAGYTFQWKKDGISIAGATNSTYKVKQSGNYAVEVFREGCGVVSASVNITVNKLLSVEPNESWVKIRPNPVSSDLYIDLPSGESIKSISIFSVDGKEVLKKRVLDQDCALKLDTLPRGKYILRGITSKGVFSRNLLLE